MAELPTGTVTFLFTDIEGSTRLLKQLRDVYADLLTAHQRLLRAAFEEAGGQEIDTQGDSFFVAFRRAKDAIAAAVAAQRAIAAHTWPDGVQVRVRMGIHTGEPTVGADRYVGLGIHRAARIMAAGHGGQVLLSNATRELIADDLPPNVGLRDLGEHRLKDIDRPERVFQLVAEGLPPDFPPLKTVEGQPAEATPFDSREAELADAAQAAVAARRQPQRTLLLAALIGVLGAAVAIPVFALGRGDSGGGSPEIRGNVVGVIDPDTNALVGAIPVGLRPGPLAFGSAALWVANLDDETVSRIDPNSQDVVSTIAIGDTLGDLAAGQRGVWAFSTSPATVVRRIDPRFNSASQPIKIKSLPGGSGGVAVGRAAVWVAPSFGLISRIDPDSNDVIGTTDPRGSPTSIAIGAPDALWVADESANTVSRIDAANVVTPITVGRGPSAVAVGEQAVWVAETLDDVVVRIDPGRGTVTTTIPVGRAPTGVAVGEDAVWVANSLDGTVSRIDPASNDVVETIDVGGSPQDVAVGAGRVWVSVQGSVLDEAAAATEVGGILNVNAAGEPVSLDPGLALDVLSWQLGYATCAKLLTYPDKPAPAGSQLVPEIAESLPTSSPDGRSYTFTVRKGFRFSPPSNEPVTAETFKYALERALDPRMKSEARFFLSDVVGAETFMAGKARHLSGVIARGNKLTIKLVDAAPDFLARITMPTFCPVPLGTPIDRRGVRAVPSAGPYYVAAYTPGQGIVLKRNPNYKGGRPHHLDEIRVTVGVGKAQSVRQIEAGSADYVLDGVPPEAVARLVARYGPDSKSAKAGRQQYFLGPVLHTDFLALNSERPLFADVRMRRAVGYAIDRQALARQGTLLYPLPAKPTDQLLPPGMHGFRDARIYPFDPDISKARQLARGRRGDAVLWTCNVSPCRQVAEIVKANLGAIGIAVEIEQFPLEVFSAKLTGNPSVDIVALPQFAEFQDPGHFLRVIRNIVGAPYKGKLDAAAKLSGPRRYLRYAELDAELARKAVPAVAYANATAHDFFSARIGCQIFQPVYGVDLAALCIRR